MLPKTFIKSLSFTLLIAFQAQSTDFGLSYWDATGLRKEYFIIIGLVILIVAGAIYRLWLQRIAGKDKTARE